MIPNSSPRKIVHHKPDNIKFLLEREHKHRARYGYMSNQTEFTPEIRATLVNWVIELHYMLKLEKYSLYLSVNIIDRYLSKKQIHKNKVQLLGVASMLIASKYEESVFISIKDLKVICNNWYTKTHICEMELDILKTIEYSLTHVITPAHFIDSMQMNFNIKKFVEFLCEISLLNYELIKFPPSVIVGACLVLGARICLERANFIKIKEDILIVVSKIISTELKNQFAKEESAIKTKFSQRIFFEKKIIITYI